MCNGWYLILSLYVMMFVYITSIFLCKDICARWSTPAEGTNCLFSGSSQARVTAKASTPVALGKASGNKQTQGTCDFSSCVSVVLLTPISEAGHRNERRRNSAEAKRDLAEFAPTQSHLLDKKPNLEIGIFLHDHSGRMFYEFLLLRFYLTNHLKLSLFESSEKFFIYIFLNFKLLESCLHRKGLGKLRFLTDLGCQQHIPPHNNFITFPARTKAISTLIIVY